MPDTDTTHSYAISWWRGEFVDRSVEANFRSRRAGDLTRHTVVAVIVGAALFMSFWFMDVASLDWGAGLLWLLLIRSFVFVLALATAFWLIKSPIEAMHGRAVSLFEICGLLGFAIIMAIRGEPAAYYGMSLAVLLTGIYLLIPNRVIYALAISGVTTEWHLVKL